MFRIILLVTAFAFLTDPAAASGNSSADSEETKEHTNHTKNHSGDLAKFLKKLHEDYKNAGLDKVLLDFKDEWKKFMDSGTYNSSECDQSDLRKFLKQLDVNLCKGGTMKDEEVLEEKWSNFTKEFGQEYPPEEIPMRKEVFKKNEKSAEEHNVLFREGKSTYEMGLNQLAAMTDEEYISRNDLKIDENVTEPTEPTEPEERNNTNNCRKKRVARQAQYPIQPTPFKYDRNAPLPSSVDWRKKGYVSPVQNQGQCGSCYSFSAAAQLEALHKRVYGQLVKLSEQNIVDCTWNLGNNGCHGGWMHKAFQYAQKNGIARASDYPYTHSASYTCRQNQNRAQKFVDGFVIVPSGDEQALKYAVAKYGPIAIGMDANNRGFMLYRSGLFNDPQCVKRVNHAILLVGYGTHSKYGDYWIVKNSWGTSWGMKGYALMARNRNNACGVASYATFAYKKMK